MAAPKNWDTDKSPSFYDGRAKHSKPVEYAWDHRNSDYKVIVWDESDFDTYHIYLAREGNGISASKELGRSSGYRNKKKARKAAVRWMRNHPHAGQKPKPDPQNEYIKVWKDEGRLKAGFFDSSNNLVEEIPVQDTNSNDIDSLAKELQQAYDMRVKKGYRG